eukprot:1184451-Prorocentrum_minimum.AAC.5
MVYALHNPITETANSYLLSEFPLPRLPNKTHTVPGVYSQDPEGWTVKTPALTQTRSPALTEVSTFRLSSPVTCSRTCKARVKTSDWIIKSFSRNQVAGSTASHTGSRALWLHVSWYVQGGSCKCGSSLSRGIPNIAKSGIAFIIAGSDDSMQVTVKSGMSEAGMRTPQVSRSRWCRSIRQNILIGQLENEVSHSIRAALNATRQIPLCPRTVGKLYRRCKFEGTPGHNVVQFGFITLYTGWTFMGGAGTSGIAPVDGR